MRHGIANRAIGTEVLRPHFSALLAEALAKNGQLEEGLRLLEEAIEAVKRSEEACYEAELYRLKGEVLLMRGIPATGLSLAATSGQALIGTEPLTIAQAEACFNRSIKIAHQQKAKSWELRAAMSLARLYRDQSKQEEARTLLTRTYSSFTEGFATTDLREAKALLDEL
jgi:predicted ATPase